MPSPHQKLRPTTVANPFYSRAHPADASNPATIPAVVNIRESAETTLAARGKLEKIANETSPEALHIGGFAEAFLGPKLAQIPRAF
jgi:hypothetical protein